MCSIEDDGEIGPQMYDHNQSLQGKKCVKCDQAGVVVTRIHDSFCKSCFQVYVIHKFRAAIGKSKLIREGEKVLVAFSGGANSSALLHLIQDGLSERAHKKLRFTPALLHVDECGVLDVKADRQELRQQVIRLMLSSGFPSYITDLEQALKIERKKKQIQVSAGVTDEEDVCLYQQIEDEFSGSALPSSSQRDKLRSLISSLVSVTSKEDFIRNLRNQLIVSVAHQLGFNKVLTAECSTRLSIRILADVAQGRGSQVSLNTAFCDGRNGDVLFIRPVRDLNAKELVMYNSLFEVESVFIPNITTKTARDSSIERLTETFVTGLQADFSSTVTNIVRTSEKLESANLEDNQQCAFCQSPLDTNVGKASALYSIEFSQKLLQTAPAGCGQDGDICEHQEGVQCQKSSCGQECTSSNQEGVQCQKSSCGQECTSSKLSYAELNKTLCYGCRVTVQNFNCDTSPLPDFITRESVESRERERLRDKISEFLLEDSDS